jgi:hypothetical protein
VKAFPLTFSANFSGVRVAPRLGDTNSLAKPCPEETEGPYYVREQSERTLHIDLEFLRTDNLCSTEGLNYQENHKNQ